MHYTYKTKGNCEIFFIFYSLHNMFNYSGVKYSVKRCLLRNEKAFAKLMFLEGLLLQDPRMTLALPAQSLAQVLQYKQQ